MADFHTRPYGPDGSQYVEIWPPGRSPAGPPLGTAVLIHGGYWRDRYGLDLMHPMARHLAATGWAVVNIEYRRLAEPADGGETAATDPETWDFMSSDVVAAMAGVRDRPVVVIGHSAGGHLALWAAANSEQVDAVIALAPVADLVEADRLSLSGGVVRRLLGGPASAHPERYRRASPQSLVPLGVPQLVVHGDADDSVPQQLSTDYAAAAGSAGDDVDLLTPTSVDHFHIIDPNHDVWRAIDRWLRARARSASEPGTGLD